MSSRSLAPAGLNVQSGGVQLRKIIKTRGHFPNDESAIKPLWLALRNVLNKSVRSAFD